MSDFVLSLQIGRPAVSLSAGGTDGFCDGSESGTRRYWDGNCQIVIVDGPNRPDSTFGVTDSVVAVGCCRLDNRPSLVRRGNPLETALDDLSVAAEWIQRGDPIDVAKVVGDFAVATWNRKLGVLSAARDAFGIRKLYYTADAHQIAISSRAVLLAGTSELDMDFIAEFLTTGSGPSDRTIYSRVRAVPPGHLLVVIDGQICIREYWFPRLQATHKIRVDEAANEFRNLLSSSIQQRVVGSNVWARLSGGLDSSSIVCLASFDAEQRQEQSPIVGTITTVDSLGHGDERDFAREVLERYHLKNIEIRDYWLWQDDSQAPPLTDQPTMMYPFYARDRAGASQIRELGGEIMLCGMGADHYMHFPPLFITDGLSRGNIGSSTRALWNWSVARRGSFWRYARQFVVLPFLPRRVRRLTPVLHTRAPRWFDQNFVSNMAIEDRLERINYPSAPPGEQLDALLKRQLSALPTGGLAREISGAGLDVRYPFLSRPLVEFALGLPPEMLVKPNLSKWILRQAMKQVLPERIRMRSGKGTISARVLWSLQHEQQLIDRLTRGTILGQLGCINEKKLRRTLRVAHKPRRAMWLYALALETWLRVRFGQWPPLTHSNVSNGVAQATT